MDGLRAIGLEEATASASAKDSLEVSAYLVSNRVEPSQSGPSVCALYVWMRDR